MNPSRIAKLLRELADELEKPETKAEPRVDAAREITEVDRERARKRLRGMGVDV